MSAHVHGPGCAHGAGTGENDVVGRVAVARRRSATFASLTLAGAACLAVVSGGPWGALAAAAACWVAASAAGAATIQVAAGRRSGPVVVVAAAVTALVTTATAAAVGLVWGPEAWVAAAAGWAGAAALAQAALAALWRWALLRPGSLGEAARDQAVRAATPRWAGRLGWWILPSLAFGLWVWLLGSAPVTASLVLPAAILLQLLLARHTLRRAA